jgi:HD-GYP domain-containing protein (c-di-GMP phosphodiesterase class II)
MRFSDLNKNKADTAPEQKKPARPAPAPAREAAPAKPEPAPRPAAPAAPQAPAQGPTRTERPATPAGDREEAVKKHIGPYKPKNRAEARLTAEPEPPFRDLDAKARDVYSRVLEQAGELLRGAEQPYTEKYEAVLRACDLASETLKTNSVLLNYASYSTAEDYLKAHSANVTLIALAMGQAAGLENQEMRLLGFCAMAHDIGMADYSGLYSQAVRLPDEDFASLTRHSEAGMLKLDRIVDLDYKLKDRAKRVILQVHERADGSGYPDGVPDAEIDPLAQLIGIADVYEAMTHPRAWREALNPPDVIKELIEREGHGFNSRAVKALLSALSIYPPGSLVMLSTGEIGRVAKINKGSLTRPTVEIMLDPEFSQTARQRLDLMEHPLTTIERPLDPAELQDRNPKFAAKLELERWWVAW